MNLIKENKELFVPGSERASQNGKQIKKQKKVRISPVTDTTIFKIDEAYAMHLASIVESSDDAIISKSVDGTIKSWNKGAEKMFGYTAEQTLGKNISIIIPPDCIKEEEDIIAKIRNNEIINHFETIRKKKNGELFHVSLTISPLKDSKGNLLGVSKIARDISSRKQSEAEEKEAAALLIVNRELVLQNDEKERSEAELIITNKELAFQNDEKEKRAAELLIVIEELKNSKDDVRTLNEELEQKVVERTMQLQSANKELESFSYSVSHDLRAPLRAVNGYAKMLKRDYAAQLDSEANRLMDTIMGNAKKMGQLIDELLNFSRLGRKELIMAEIPMQAMVTNICDELKIEKDNKHITFSVKNLLPADGDTATIKQVWLNLLSNAIKYSRLIDKPVIEIGSDAEGDEIIYHVKDNGAGFDMRYADKLFGVFQRLHSDEEFEGIGVGLAIVHRIITKHGGKVWAIGKVNEGATFFFSLKK